MKHVISPSGARVSFDQDGSGPPLVLVHGGFSDHHTNWEFVTPMLRRQFTICTIARRGRGETDATEGHSVDEEARDVVAVIESLGEPVFLVGHSYGAQCSLAAAAMVPDRVRRLVLYEPAWPRVVSPDAMVPLERLAAAGAWDDFAMTFFRDRLFVPVAELEALRATDLWPPIISDARASLGDLRALSRYDFSAERFHSLGCPVLLQIGSESRRDLYATDALAAALPDVRIEVLAGQAHEGMTTAPELYVQSLTRFLLE